MPSFFDKVETATGRVPIKTPRAGTTVTFGNSSNPPNWFNLTTEQLVSALQDIATNRQAFVDGGAAVYGEPKIRALFAKYLKNETAKAQGGTQTLPVYTVLSRIIHFANSEADYVFKTMDLDANHLNNAIQKLQQFTTDTMEAAVAQNTPVLSEADRIKGGDNILVYGAPGTGKSYNVKKLGTGAREFRTVFHPDMQNSDFVGALKPAVDANGNVSYEFRPGPFARSLQFANANPAKRVHLVIEELNRAMASAVFGELFQLLDRDDDGTSEYTVDCPSTEFAGWYGSDHIQLPSNLWIYATMNSADQGVYPLDTAFRRRWKQVYTPIDYANAPAGNIEINVNGMDPVEISWPVFVKKLNEHLVTQLEIPEDRLVGPRFLSAKDLLAGTLPGKLLIYLWDDLLRHHGRQKLFRHSIRSYGALHAATEIKGQIFSDEFLSFLTGNTATVETAGPAEIEA